MAKPPADSEEMVMGPDAVAEDTVAGSDRRELQRLKTTYVKMKQSPV